MNRFNCVCPSLVRCISHSMVLCLGLLFTAQAQEAETEAKAEPKPDGTRGHLVAGAATMGATPTEGAVVMIGAVDDFPHLQHEEKPGGKIPWDFKDGVMTIVPKSGNVCTVEPVTDFKLHLEFATNHNPEKWGNDGNSGIYIQRRYEVQILNSHKRDGKEGRDDYGTQDCGALYKQRRPDVNACKPHGEWQAYDIVFRAARFEGETKTENARITVMLNGQMLHDDVEITSKTGAGKAEGPEPDVLRLQEHGNAVQFRNVWYEHLKL